MLIPGTGPLGRGVRSSVRLAALLLATDFVAGTVAQSTGSPPEPNTGQQTQIRQDDIPAPRWLRNLAPQSPLTTGIQASPTLKPSEVEGFQIGQKSTKRWVGLATQARTQKNLITNLQERTARAELRDNHTFRTADTGDSFDDTATLTMAVNSAVPANEVSAEILPLEPSAVLSGLCVSTTRCAAWFSTPRQLSQSRAPQSERPIEDNHENAEAATPPAKIVRPSKPIDFNQSLYYRNKLEFSFETGWHPVNIPFVYDFAVGDSYNETPLKYTLVPLIASLRWHVNDVKGRWIFRGNFDFTFSLSATLIPRGPETHYFAFIFGIRRNFVHRNWRIVPYFDERGGVGYIDAKEPLGVLFAQGQNLTFTYDMGTGVRYNLSPKYSFSAGMNYMHISNGYLSEPKFTNYGINVYGPMVGIDVRLGKPHHYASQ